MPYISAETKEYTTPETGVVVKMKMRQTYGDQKAIYEIVFGDSLVSGDGTSNMRVSLAQAFSLSSTKLSRMIVSWDLLDSNGVAVPVSLESVEEWLTEKDVKFLTEKTEIPKQ